MKIRIKNVTGSEENQWCLIELSRAGFPEGSIIKNANFDERNKSFKWSRGNTDCVAYLGETCEAVLKERNIKRSLFNNCAL